jgi:hypothetical protein
VGSVRRVKRFTAGWKRFAGGEDVETEVRKWLRQQSKDFDALVKRWDKCSSVGGGYVEVGISHVLYPESYRVLFAMPSAVWWLAVW